MPVMNGFEATKKILAMAKKANGLIPDIVAVTGDSTLQNITFANEAGMCKIIQKPFDTSELKNLL